jgi:hypothetical protein
MTKQSRPSTIVGRFCETPRRLTQTPYNFRALLTRHELDAY